MFELSDKSIEDIVFAMEDQEGDMVVDLETGEVLPRGVAPGEDYRELAEEGGGDIPAGDRYVDPPGWTSRDGFKLMEDFLALVRQPTARRELQAALSRGRGVFKTFKAALAAFPDVERAFRDYKFRMMRRPITRWYDDQREALGLARLGPEPEDTGDLVASEMDLRVVALAEAREAVEALVRETADEAFTALPAPIVACEEARLLASIGGVADALCVLADDGEGGALGAAIAFREVAGERSLGRIVFVGVKKEFRSIGLGTLLIETIAKRLAAEGLCLVVVDSPFLPPDFGAKLGARGYAAYGTRAVARNE